MTFNFYLQAIDQTRIGLQYLQAKVYSSADLLSTSPHAHTHSHSHSASSHSHETDFVARSIRSDRDLLDIITLIHVLLTSRKDEPEIQGAVYEQSMSRVRKGLRVLAFYSKLYASGADMVGIFFFFSKAYEVRSDGSLVARLLVCLAYDVSLHIPTRA